MSHASNRMQRFCTWIEAASGSIGRCSQDDAREEGPERGHDHSLHHGCFAATATANDRDAGQAEIIRQFAQGVYRRARALHLVLMPAPSLLQRPDLKRNDKNLFAVESEIVRCVAVDVLNEFPSDIPRAFQRIGQGHRQARLLVFCSVAPLQFLNVLDARLCYVFLQSPGAWLLHPPLLGHNSLEGGGGSERK